MTGLSYQAVHELCVWLAGPVHHRCKRYICILELWFGYDFYFESFCILFKIF